jgi:hypothetical protein
LPLSAAFSLEDSDALSERAQPENPKIMPQQTPKNSREFDMIDRPYF